MPLSDIAAYTVYVYFCIAVIHPEAALLRGWIRYELENVFVVVMCLYFRTLNKMDFVRNMCSVTQLSDSAWHIHYSTV